MKRFSNGKRCKHVPEVHDVARSKVILSKSGDDIRKNYVKQMRIAFMHWANFETAHVMLERVNCG